MPHPSSARAGVAYDVTIGKSLHHTLRYSFKPSSIDATKRGKLNVRGPSVELKMPSTNGGSVVFAGKSSEHKSSEYMLVCRKGEWTLERLGHNILNLKAEREEKKAVL